MGVHEIPRMPFSNPFPLAEELVRPTQPTNQPTGHPFIHPPQPRREFGLRAWLAGWLGLTMMGHLTTPILEGSIAGGGAMPSWRD